MWRYNLFARYYHMTSHNGLHSLAELYIALYIAMLYKTICFMKSTNSKRTVYPHDLRLTVLYFLYLDSYRSSPIDSYFLFIIL